MTTAYGMKVKKGTVELTSDDLITIHSTLMTSTSDLFYRIQDAKNGKPDRVHGNVLSTYDIEVLEKVYYEEEKLLYRLEKVVYMSRYDSHDGSMTMDGSMGITDLMKETEHNKKTIAYLSVIDKGVSRWINEKGMQ